MSKYSKGKILETIVAMIEESLADDPGVKIIPNYKMIDVDGIKREIDIYIETNRSGRVFKIAIECKNYKSNIKLEQLDAFINKCRKLKIDRPIFVTASKFQAGVRIRAENENVDLIELTTEETTAERISQEFNTKSVRTIRKEYEFKSIKFRKKDCPQYYYLYDFKLYNKDDQEINIEDVKSEIISQQQDKIYGYLNTSKGIIFNYKKIISPTFGASDLFFKEGCKLVKIEDLFCRIEIWYESKGVSFNKINRYQESLSDKVLSSFISYESDLKGTKYSFSIVKNSDDDIQHFMMDKTNPKSITKLKTLFTFPASAKFEKLILNSQKVIIQPLEYNVTDNVVSDTAKLVSTNPKHSFSKKVGKKNHSKSLVGIDGVNNKLFFSLLIKKDKKMYTTSKFPHPIHLYFAQSLNQYVESERLKEIFPVRVIGSVQNENIDILLDDTYHKYFQNKIGSVMIMNMALESFMNFYLPNSTEKRKYVLEQELSFVEKLKIICNIDNHNIDLTKKHKEIKSTLEGLNTLSMKLANLPSETTNNPYFPPYVEVFEELENFKLLDCIKTAKQFMNLIKPDFIQTVSK